MHVRPVRRGDHDAVLRLADRLTIGVARWRDEDAVAEAVGGWLRESLADPWVDVLVAVERRDEVVGVVSLSTRAHFTGEPDAYVRELVVAQGHERRGVGRRLVAAAEAWAAERGHRCVTLETGAANTSARAFYASLGYLEEDVRLTRPLPAAGGEVVSRAP